MKPNFRWLVRYGGALAAVGAGYLLRVGLTALAGEGLPTYITFYPAVMAVALLGGFGPGLVATVAAALVVDYALLPPRGQLGIENLVDAVGLAVFLSMGLFMSLVAELYRRVRQRAAMYEKHVPPWESQEEPPQTLGQRLLLNGGMVLSLAILATAGWHAQRNMAAMVEADRLVTRTYVANEQIEHLLMALQDMDRSVRGYLITGQEEFLQPYLAALPESAKRLAALQAQSRKTPALAQRLAGLEPLVADRLALWKETLELRQSKGFEAAQALVATGKGSALTEDIRRQMAGVQQEQDQLFRERTEAKDASLRRARQALLAGGVLGFLMLAAVFVFLRQENAGRRQAQAELRQHRDHLQDIVTARTAELAQANESMRQDREDLDRAQAVGQIGSWRLDLGRNVLTWSDENQRMFGLPKGPPLTYEAFLGCVHPEDRKYVDTQWKAALAGKPYDIEHRIVAGGQVKWVREKAYLDFDAAGKLVGGFGITQDVTDRKAAEEALRASEGQLRQHVAELQAANEEVQTSRRAAVNLMEDCGPGPQPGRAGQRRGAQRGRTAPAGAGSGRPRRLGLPLPDRRGVLGRALPRDVGRSAGREDRVRRCHCRYSPGGSCGGGRGGQGGSGRQRRRRLSSRVPRRLARRFGALDRLSRARLFPGRGRPAPRRPLHRRQPRGHGRKSKRRKPFGRAKSGIAAWWNCPPRRCSSTATIGLCW